MINPNHLKTEIENIQKFLISKGYTNQDNFVFIKNEGRKDFTVCINNLGDEIFLGDANNCHSYEELYYFYHKNRVFLMELIDGALIQIEYVIRNNNLWSYRLAFLPNPRLIAQEIEPDMYETEELFFIDSINKPVIHPVIRFDFDNDPTHYVPVKHSRSHLTIGQSDKCRIALSEPLTPYKFITFIFEHFYGSLYEAIKADLITLKAHALGFGTCLQHEEKEYLHLNVGK